MRFVVHLFLLSMGLLAESAWAAPSAEQTTRSAREWLEKACKKEDAAACTELGLFLSFGIGGEAKVAEGERLLELWCVERSFGPACSRLAGLHRYDTVRQVEYLGKACAAGVFEACTEQKEVRGSSEAEEAAATTLGTAASDAMAAGDVVLAREKLAELDEKYPNTRAYKRADRLRTELSIVGMDAGEPQVRKWFGVPGNFVAGRVTILSFWETWCPHCKREMPNLAELYRELRPEGLEVVSFTKITKTSTEDKVWEFIRENHIDFPVGHEDGAMTARFGVSGIPAVAVVRDGKVIWRGHPARLSKELIRGWLSSSR